MKTFVLIAFCVGLLLPAFVSAQVISTEPADSTVSDTSTYTIPEGDQSLITDSTNNSRLKNTSTKEQNEELLQQSGILPEVKNYGTITEIKQLEDYNPKETVTSLKKGNFGKPIDYAKDSINWKKGIVMGLDVNQGTLTNWAAGGDHFSLSLRARVNMYANYSDGRNSWDNNVEMSLGFLKSSSQGIRKSDDKLELYSKYSYRFSSKSWFLSALLNFRSQFANGYNYPDDSTIISHFLAPGYLLGSLGITFKPVEHFSILLSPFTSRFVIVNDQRLANEGAFGVDKAEYEVVDNGYRFMIHPGKRLSYELGAYTSILFKKEILKNVIWDTRLELYSNYLENPQNIDVHWNSLLSCKVNKFISASLTTELIYDDNIKYITYAKNADGSIKTNPDTGEKVILGSGPRIQFKELIGLGFAYEF